LNDADTEKPLGGAQPLTHEDNQVSQLRSDEELYSHVASEPLPSGRTPARLGFIVVIDGPSIIAGATSRTSAQL